MPNPFDYIKSINGGKHIAEPVDPKEYSPYLVTFNFSLFPDTILPANEINCLPNITPQMHYDYLRYSIRPRSRFKKWPKKDKVNAQNIALIRNVYKYSTPKAITALGILSDSQIRWIQEQQEKGG